MGRESGINKVVNGIIPADEIDISKLKAASLGVITDDGSSITRTSLSDGEFLKNEGGTLQGATVTAVTNFQKVAMFSLQTISTGTGSTAEWGVGDYILDLDTNGGQGSAETHAEWYVTEDLFPVQNLSVEMTVQGTPTLAASTSAFIMLGFHDGTIDANTGLPSGNDYGYVRFRNNFNSVQIVTQEGGSGANATNGTATTLSDGDTVRVEYTASSIELFVNDVSKGSRSTGVPNEELKPFIGVSDADSGNALDVQLQVSDITIGTVT